MSAQTVFNPPSPFSANIDGPVTNPEPVRAAARQLIINTCPDPTTVLAMLGLEKES